VEDLMPFASRLAMGVAAVALSAPAALAQQSPGDAPAVQTPESADRDVVVITGVGHARTSDELFASSTVLDTQAVTDRLAGGLGDTLAGLPGVSSTSFHQ